MKLIPLTQGKFAQVDDEDYDFLLQWKWHVRKNSNTWYVSRMPLTVKDKKRIPIQMHREIMKTPKGIVVDHIDHNGLNNQKHNLRNCTHANNMKNKVPSGASKYLGVYLMYNIVKGKKYSYWKSQIRINEKTVSIGTFKTEANAAIAYNIYAEKYYGEFANYNTANK